MHRNSASSCSHGDKNNGNGQAPSSKRARAHPCRKLAGSFISFYPDIGRALGGDIKAALFVEYLLYHARFKNPGGTIYRTIKQIERDTLLSRREQERARAVLVKAEVLAEGWDGWKHRMAFAVDEERLCELVSRCTKAPSPRCTKAPSDARASNSTENFKVSFLKKFLTEENFANSPGSSSLRSFPEEEQTLPNGSRAAAVKKAKVHKWLVEQRINAAFEEDDDE